MLKHHSRIIKAGFVRTRSGQLAMIAALAIGVAGLFTDYWRIAALPFVAVGIWVLLSGEQEPEATPSDQPEAQSIKQEP